MGAAIGSAIGGAHGLRVRPARRRTEVKPAGTWRLVAGFPQATPKSSGRRIRTGIIAIIVVLLVALTVPTIGSVRGVTALELEAIVGLPVWLVSWRRTRSAPLPRSGSRRDP